MKIDLGQKLPDITTSVLKGALGTVPIAGSFLAEIIGAVIPNQRIDRVEKFLADLDQRLTSAEKQQFSDNPYALNLFEDGILQSARALSEVRNRYIATFLKNCSWVEKDTYDIKKKLFYILQEITDVDIEILLSTEHYKDSQLKYQLSPEMLTYGQYDKLNDEERFDYDSKKETWGLHITTLERHGLIDPVYEKLDPRDPINHLDKETGLPKMLHHKVTKLGKIFIQSIGEDTYKFR